MYPGVDVEMVSLSLTGSPAADPGQADLPAVGSKVPFDSFFDIFTELRVGGSDFQIDSFFDITYLIDNRGSGHPPGPSITEDPPSGSWQTEMISMSLTGTHASGPITIRESPTIPSVGQHNITDFGDGTGQMDSFFDIWTEVRIGDASQPFIPADTSIRVELTQIIPEPSSALLIGVGLMMLFGCRRFSG